MIVSAACRNFLFFFVGGIDDFLLVGEGPADVDTAELLRLLEENGPLELPASTEADMLVRCAIGLSSGEVTRTVVARLMSGRC